LSWQIRAGWDDALSTAGVLRRAFRYVAPFRRLFAAKVALTFVSLAPLLLLPWPLKAIIDHVIDGAPVVPQAYPWFVRPLASLLQGLSPHWILFWITLFLAGFVLCVGALGSGASERSMVHSNLVAGQDRATSTENFANTGWSFAGGLLGLFEFRITMRLTQALNHYYRTRLLRRLLDAPLVQLARRDAGDAIYRVMYDTPALTQVVYLLTLVPLVAPVAILATAATLLDAYDDPTIFWAAILALPLVLVVTLPLAGPIRRAGLRSREAGARTTATAEESMAHAVAIQALGGAEREAVRFATDSWASFARHRRTILVQMLAGLFALAVGVWLVRWSVLYVASSVIDGHLTRGDFPVLGAYFLQIAKSSIELGSLWIRAQEASTGLVRAFEIEDLEAPPNLGSSARSIDRVHDSIELDDVHFAYPGGGIALRGAHLEARVGELTAIVGPSGAGKTTLALVAAGLLQPDQGCLRVDGIPARELGAESFRASLAIALQENPVFSGTVAENIRLGNLGAGIESVRDAARRAGASQFIEALPDGYDTWLGLGGARLSGGQRQRLCLARALVRTASVLILDEPTASLDAESERLVTDLVRNARLSAAVVVIAHRLSTVRHADQILFMKDGSIVERGTHEDLMAVPAGAYREFVELQRLGADAPQ
jgi:ABC-type multidrug transport system fused ATPase/permease subunit